MSAIAAALGLLFSGTVAWFSVSAMRQQLEQNRRYQAGRVTFWYVITEGGYGTVVVNRSLDSVPDLNLDFHVYKVATSLRRHSASIGLGTLPPCTRLTFPPGSFFEALTSTGEFRVPKDTTPDDIRFTDTDGRSWVRNEASLRGDPRNGTSDGQVASYATAEVHPHREA
ncbi:hypothetical protein [Streptomyces sp. NPDC059008]|uniref:hypothetical protein n=1 Tax=Streptomyces sp. NPDC059008 TaxID=3346693 RepID=UPI0036A2B8DB